MSCSEVDHTFDGPSRRLALDILQERKKTFHYQLFSGVEHGFALRGDPNDAYQRKYNSIALPLTQETRADNGQDG
jgi:dienelactone hydrolase